MAPFWIFFENFRTLDCDICSCSYWNLIEKLLRAFFSIENITFKCFWNSYNFLSFVELFSISSVFNCVSNQFLNKIVLFLQFLRAFRAFKSLELSRAIKALLDFQSLKMNLIFFSFLSLFKAFNIFKLSTKAFDFQKFFNIFSKFSWRFLEKDSLHSYKLTTSKVLKFYSLQNYPSFFTIFKAFMKFFSCFQIFTWIFLGFFKMNVLGTLSLSYQNYFLCENNLLDIYFPVDFLGRKNYVFKCVFRHLWSFKRFKCWDEKIFVKFSRFSQAEDFLRLRIFLSDTSGAFTSADFPHNLIIQ